MPAYEHTLHLDQTFRLTRGGELSELDIAYETWGTLNADRSNAVLICHAISGDAHAARQPDDPEHRPGWWDALIGPGGFIDTDRFYVICSNVLGGCRGTTGPSSMNPRTGEPFGPDFPAITLQDMVNVEVRLLDHLGIRMLHAAVGGSLGGHQVMVLATEHPGRVRSAVVIASSPRLTAQSMGFDVVARNAIKTDPHFNGGRYYGQADQPVNGLAIARMIGHITYLSVDAMNAKFDPDRHQPRDIATAFEKRFAVGTYLAHQGQVFTERFDANSYLAISTAMDFFDLGHDHATLCETFSRATCDWLIVSFSSDWLFSPAQSRQIVNSLNALNQRVTYTEITTAAGHDAFLLTPDVNQYGPLIAARLNPTSPADPKRLTGNEQRILQWIPADASVLDLGCGSGRLLSALQQRARSAIDTHDNRLPRFMGVEVAQPKLIAAAQRGVDVIDYDLNRGLPAFTDDQFDVVVLSATLQIIDNVELLLDEMTRVGRSAILSFTNFAFRELREMFARTGRSPRSAAGRGQYNFNWYDTPNRRFPSIIDLEEFCVERGLLITKAVYLHEDEEVPADQDPNLNADTAIICVARRPSIQSPRE